MPTNLEEPRRGVKGPHEESWHDRRRSLNTLTVWGSAVGLTWLFAAEGSHTAGQTEALLLSCMDFRLMDATARYMASRGLAGKYDHIILAGATLGALTEKFPAWNQTFWDHVGVASDLHKVHKVIVLDHRDCGGYQVILGEDLAADPAKETAIHTTQLKQLGKRVREKYPTLEGELLLMALNGKVEVIS
jgi:hypothetical protein